MNSLTETFCLLDDFCKSFEKKWKNGLLMDGTLKRMKQTGISLSEIMTLVVFFHQGSHRHFKHYYLDYICDFFRGAFPKLPSYPRFIELMQRCCVPLVALFEHLKGECTGISFADSTAIAVCHNKRIYRHRVFRGAAERGKTSMGWFYGFKLHLVINPNGELIAAKLTSGNKDDRKALYEMKKSLFGNVYADRGYVSQPLKVTLLSYGIRLITRVRSNMKAVKLDAFDSVMLKCRSLIETVNDQLKNLCQIEHSRHRSLANFTVNLIAGIVAYCLQPKNHPLNSIALKLKCSSLFNQHLLSRTEVNNKVFRSIMTADFGVS